ncbi:MAG: hypothetical protein FWF26_04975 [Treponema sp.]|nr:hypothetical protein [Treponema sp.]
MFSLFSSLKVKKTVKRVIPAVLALVVLAVALGSCSTDSSEPSLLDKLNGTWKGTFGDAYVINGSTLTNLDYKNDTAFTGKIKQVIKLPVTGKATDDDASGVIIYQYIIPPTEYSVNFNDGYTALYYKGDVNGNTLMLANAYNVADYLVPVDVENPGDAISCFTAKDYFENFIGEWAEYLIYTR